LIKNIKEIIEIKNSAPILSELLILKPFYSKKLKNRAILKFITQKLK